MRNITFISTVKGGLIVKIDAEYTMRDGWVVTDLRVKRKNGKFRSAWPSLYRELANSPAELRRLNEEALNHA